MHCDYLKIYYAINSKGGNVNTLPPLTVSLSNTVIIAYPAFRRILLISFCLLPGDAPKLFFRL